MTNKHAYLIIAHNNFEQLALLLRLLDDVRNDIYLHIDAKQKNIPELSSCVTRATLTVLEPRMDVRWGECSQIECELYLYRSALEQGYAYYHLLSGVDMPLKSQNFIHDFFASHSGEEFISVVNDRVSYQRKLRLLTLFRNSSRKTGLYDSIIRMLNRISYTVQSVLRYDNVGDKLGELRKGSNWCSLTHDAVEEIVERMREDIKWYKYSLCCDEIYKQTILCNSPKLANRILPPPHGLSAPCRLAEG